MATARMVGQIGRVVGGRYRLLAPVGTGASADVFVADDVTLRRRVAVKVLHAALAGDESFLRRFRAEARTVAGLRHPNIMGVYDWGEEADGPYLVLEFLSGGSLRDMLDEGHRLSPSQALLVGLESARALDYAHRRGLVHRDVKPANLLFDDEARLCVADFGIARALAEATWTEPAGAVVGTARYASPEQVRGNTVDGKADVYGLALVLIEAVTGTVPFSADTTIATLMGRLERPIPMPDSLGALGEALAGAGALDPGDRLDAAGLVAALDGAARRLPRPAPLPLTPLDAVDLAAPVADPTMLARVSAPPVGAPAVVPGRPAPPANGTVFDALADPTLAGELGPPSRVDPTAVVPAVSAPPPAITPWSAPSPSPSAAPAEAALVRGRRHRRWPKALLVVVMLLLLGAGAAFAVIRAVTPTYAVPAVTGPMLAALDQAPLPHHFKVRERHVSQDGTTAGQVLVSLQAPPAGAKRQSGSTITVTISDGQSFVGIPNLHGMTEDAAKAALGVVGLVEGNVTRPYRDDVPPGQVVSWSPQGQLRKGSPVDLVISAGSAPIAIPDVSGLSLADARAKLAAAGLTQLANDQVYSTTVTSGQVVGTDPAAGANGRGVTITVHVSKGPQIVKVPDMTGETVQQATADLGAIGLHVGQVFGVGKNGHVVATDPAAGQAVPQGSAVDLFVDR